MSVPAKNTGAAAGGSLPAADEVQSSRQQQSGSDSWKRYARLLDETKSLEQGKQIHKQLLTDGFRNHLFLSNHLLNMYITCGSLRDAQILFSSMPQRNTVSWSAMIRGNGERGDFKQALFLFRLMLQEGIDPDMVLFLALIKAAPGQEESQSREDVKAVQDSVERCGFGKNFMVGTALIGMYGRCGSLQEARDAFDRIQEPNAVSWNALITIFWRNKQARKSITLFREMQLEGIPPTRVTFICLASACTELQMLVTGRWIHDCAIERGFIAAPTVANAIMNLYSKCNRLDLARSVFERMNQRDVSSWNTMIAAFGKNGNPGAAFDLYKKFLEERRLHPDGVTFVNVLEACNSADELHQGKIIHSNVSDHGLESDLVVATALVSMYRRCGSLPDAVKMFERIKNPGVITCNSIIAAFADYGLVSESLLHFRRMLLQGTLPSKFTFITVLSACSNRAALSEGKLVHSLIAESTIKSTITSTDTLVQNALVNMYGKCGQLQTARETFDQNLQLKNDISSWNAMISVYAQHGCGDEAVDVFCDLQQMGIQPDGITYTGVLSASSHSRLLEVGVQLFYGISHDYDLKPSVEHYGCVTDLLGRAGWLEEAEKFLHQMPGEPDSASWMALLGGCRMYGDEERGARAAERIAKLEPQHAGSYTVMSNLYCASGKWEEADELRKAMMANGVRKEPGCSWIEVKNRMHEFVAKDRSHPKTEEIYAALEELRRRIEEEEGYVPQIGSVFHDVDDEHKEILLWSHSEKLALAFGLMNDSKQASSTLRIIKNLRICDDCHLVFKLAAKMSRKQIVVRDCYRFHCFRNGVCSCKDYW